MNAKTDTAAPPFINKHARKAKSALLIAASFILSSRELVQVEGALSVLPLHPVGPLLKFKQAEEAGNRSFPRPGGTGMANQTFAPEASCGQLSEGRRASSPSTPAGGNAGKS